MGLAASGSGSVENGGRQHEENPGLDHIQCHKVNWTMTVRLEKENDPQGSEVGQPSEGKQRGNKER